MSIGDLIILEQNSMTGRGGQLFNVAAGATAINAGEPVMITTRGGITVVAATNNFPTASSDYFVGIATTNSTQTSGTAGTIGVIPANTGITYLISPKVAASWDTQAEYDALVGKYVQIDLTSGAYTLLATDSVNNGCIVAAMNVNEHPGKVAVQFRSSTFSTR